MIEESISVFYVRHKKKNGKQVNIRTIVILCRQVFSCICKCVSPQPTPGVSYAHPLCPWACLLVPSSPLSIHSSLAHVCRRDKDFSFHSLSTLAKAISHSSPIQSRQSPFRSVKGSLSSCRSIK